MALDWIRRPRGGIGCLIAALATASASAQPANDDCSAGPALTVGAPVSGTTVGSTKTDFATCAEDHGDVWYTFTPATQGLYAFDTEASAATGMTVSVWGYCNDFINIEIACDAGSGAGGHARAIGLLRAGQTVWVRVSSTSEAGQAFTLQATGPLPGPANDTCASPIPLTLGVEATGTTIGAATDTVIADFAACAGIEAGDGGGNDVFFSFTPEVSDFYSFAACGSSFDTVLSVHSACPATQGNLIACNDDAALPHCPGVTVAQRGNSYITGISLTAGVTYYVRLAGSAVVDRRTGQITDALTGDYRLVVRQGGEVPPPPNDHCANATPIGADAIVFDDNINATGTPVFCAAGPDPADIWYSFTAPGPGRKIYDFSLDPRAPATSGGTLALYNSCADPQPFACFGNNFLGVEVRLSAALDANQTVLLRVSRNFGEQDEFAVFTNTSGDAPANTACGGATALQTGTPVPVNTAFAVSGATSSCGDADHLGLWYSFTATQTGYYRVGTSGAADNLLTLSISDGCDGPSRICRSFGDEQSETPGDVAATVRVDANQTILIRVAAQGNRQAAFSLGVTGPLPLPDPPTNGLCGAARVITSFPFNDTVDITAAPAPGVSVACDGETPLNTGAAVWYEYTPSAACGFGGGVFAVDRLGILSVFTGSCGSLSLVGCDDYERITLQAGTRYYILAHSTGDEAVNYNATYEITMNCAPIPPNDACGAAQAITASPTTETVNTLGASPDEPLPSCAGFEPPFHNAVWYALTTQTAGTLTVNVDTGFSYDAAAAVFSGSCGSLTEVACNSVGSSGGLLTFDLTAPLSAGQTYFVGVGSQFFPRGGPTTLRFEYTGQLGGGCRADFDSANGVQVADIFAFLRAWFANSPTADFDGQNGIQVADIFAFLRAWFAGC